MATSTTVCSTPLGAAAISTSSREYCLAGDPDARLQGTALGDMLVWVAMLWWTDLKASLLTSFTIAVTEPYSVV